MEKIANKTILDLSGLPIMVRNGGILTAKHGDKEIIIDGIDGEMPYQEVAFGVVGFYRDDLIEDENVGSDIEIDLDVIGDGCLNAMSFAFWLAFILLLTMITK